MVSSTLGSPTTALAADLLLEGRVSSRLGVAVLVERGRADHPQLPRARIGLSMFPAFIEPSAALAPTTVCSSSMKVMT